MLLYSFLICSFSMIGARIRLSTKLLILLTTLIVRSSSARSVLFRVLYQLPLRIAIALIFASSFPESHVRAGRGSIIELPSLSITAFRLNVKILENDLQFDIRFV